MHGACMAASVCDRVYVHGRWQALLALEQAQERFEGAAGQARQRGVGHDLFGADPQARMGMGLTITLVGSTSLGLWSAALR